MRKIFFSFFILFSCLFLVSCSTPLDETIKEINQRYADFNPMSEEDVMVRFKEPINIRVIDEFNHVSIWAIGYRDIDELKQAIESGIEVEGVFVTFNETVRSFQELNEETLTMEWHDKVVVDAIYAVKKVITLADLK